jgi:putative FmdB family regulatory protein
MPIYEFVCLDCGSEFEQLRSFSAHGHPPCPACASEHVSRKIGRPAIHFKGSGWYVTDSKGSKQSANGDGKGDDGKPGDEKRGEGKGSDEKSSPREAGKESGKASEPAGAATSESSARAGKAADSAPASATPAS